MLRRVQVRPNTCDEDTQFVVVRSYGPYALGPPSGRSSTVYSGTHFNPATKSHSFVPLKVLSGPLFGLLHHSILHSNLTFAFQDPDYLNDIQKRDLEETAYLEPPESVAFLLQLPRTDRKNILEFLDERRPITFTE